MNKNIEAALQALDATEKDKAILQSILYKEHLIVVEKQRDNNIEQEISDIIQSHERGDVIE